MMAQPPHRYNKTPAPTKVWGFCQSSIHNRLPEKIMGDGYFYYAEYSITRERS